MKFFIGVFVISIGGVYLQCILNTDDAYKQARLNDLKPLYSQKWTSFDDKTNEIKYEYKLCHCPNEEQKDKNASIVQYQKVDGTWKVSKIIGSHNKMDIDAGNNWFALTYYDGDSYNDICLNSRRKGKVMVVCDDTINTPTFKYLYESKNIMDGMYSASLIDKPNFKRGTEIIGDSSNSGVKSKKILDANASSSPIASTKISDCQYVFELRLWNDALCKDSSNGTHSHTGTGSHKKAGKSTGTILNILFFTFFGGYLALGMLYRKFKLGVENGVALIPNLDVWRHFLELQRDGWDYFYRENPIIKSSGSTGASRNDYASFSNPNTLNSNTGTIPAYDFGNLPPAASYTSPATNLPGQMPPSAYTSGLGNFNSNSAMGTGLSTHNILDENLLR